MKILVCGGRDYMNQKAVNTVLTSYCLKNKVHEIIEGGAQGADRCARNFALKAGIPFKTVEAQWSRFGRKAGYMRNIQMADMMPDCVIAFPGGKGTDMMKRIARERGINVVEIK